MSDSITFTGGAKYRRILLAENSLLPEELADMYNKAQQKIDKLERELEQFPDHRWMEKYYDKVEELNRAERDNEVLKKACEKITTLQLLDYDLVDARLFADKALSKIRSEGNE